MASILRPFITSALAMVIATLSARCSRRAPTVGSAPYGHGYTYPTGTTT